MKRQFILEIGLIVLLLSCSPRQQDKPPSVEALIKILQKPESEQLFEAIHQLSMMEPEQIEPAALTLGQVLQYPSRDATGRWKS